MPAFHVVTYKARNVAICSGPTSPLAEGEGFEPPKACTLVVFKTTAIDHSAIPPATSK
jgi:hypothetical protein